MQWVYWTQSSSCEKQKRHDALLMSDEGIGGDWMIGAWISSLDCRAGARSRGDWVRGDDCQDFSDADGRGLEVLWCRAQAAGGAREDDTAEYCM